MPNDTKELLELLDKVCEALSVEVDLKRAQAYGAVELITGKTAEDFAAEEDEVPELKGIINPEATTQAHAIEVAEMTRALGTAQGAEYALVWFQGAIAEWKKANGYE